MVKKRILSFAVALTIVLASSCTLPPDITPFGSWSSPICAFDTLTMTNCILAFNDDASFSLSYDASGANTQTGTFTPIEFPADTQTTFTEDAASGPDLPPATWKLIYSNLTADSVDLDIDFLGDGFNDLPVSFTRL